MEKPARCQERSPHADRLSIIYGTLLIGRGSKGYNAIGIRSVPYDTTGEYLMQHGWTWEHFLLGADGRQLCTTATLSA
jgi:hypothetical protein